MVLWKHMSRALSQAGVGRDIQFYKGVEHDEGIAAIQWADPK